MSTKVFKSGSRLVVRRGKLPAIVTPTAPPPNVVTISAPAGSFTTGATIALSGTVFPAGNIVQVALSQQNTAPPSLGLVSVTPTGGIWSRSLTVTSEGTWY